jgi:hypothetical protein
MGEASTRPDPRSSTVARVASVCLPNDAAYLDASSFFGRSCTLRMRPFPIQMARLPLWPVDLRLQRSTFLVARLLMDTAAAVARHSSSTTE